MKIVNRCGITEVNNMIEKNKNSNCNNDSNGSIINDITNTIVDTTTTSSTNTIVNTELMIYKFSIIQSLEVSGQL